MDAAAVSELAELIAGSRPYLDLFDYDHYPDCFSAFSRASEAFFSGLEGMNKDELLSTAGSLISRLEAGWQGLSRSDAKEIPRRDKQVLALFLTPAAIEYASHHAGQNAAADFADALLSAWNAKFPRNTYLAGDYRDIMEGFDANLLGLPLRKSKFNRRRKG